LMVEDSAAVATPIIKQKNAHPVAQRKVLTAELI
jgi:hypothetical protein